MIHANHDAPRPGHLTLAEVQAAIDKARLG
jgi:hypothetical protein